MSILKDVCDHWMGKMLVLDGLSLIPPANRHLYAPYSLEALKQRVNERHVAVWPNSDADSVAPATTMGGKFITASFTILVWEDASTDSATRIDDEASNAAWLDLHHGLIGMLATKANWDVQPYGLLGDLPYRGVRFDLVGTSRVMEIDLQHVYTLTAV